MRPADRDRLRPRLQRVARRVASSSSRSSRCMRQQCTAVKVSWLQSMQIVASQSVTRFSPASCRLSCPCPCDCCPCPACPARHPSPVPCTPAPPYPRPSAPRPASTTGPSPYPARSDAGRGRGPPALGSCCAPGASASGGPSRAPGRGRRSGGCRGRGRLGCASRAVCRPGGGRSRLGSCRVRSCCRW